MLRCFKLSESDSKYNKHTDMKWKARKQRMQTKSIQSIYTHTYATHNRTETNYQAESERSDRGRIRNWKAVDRIASHRLPADSMRSLPLMRVAGGIGSDGERNDTTEGAGELEQQASKGVDWMRSTRQN